MFAAVYATWQPCFQSLQLQSISGACGKTVSRPFPPLPEDFTKNAHMLVSELIDLYNVGHRTVTRWRKECGIAIHRGGHRPTASLSWSQRLFSLAATEIRRLISRRERPPESSLARTTILTIPSATHRTTPGIAALAVEANWLATIHSAAASLYATSRQRQVHVNGLVSDLSPTVVALGLT